MELCSALNRAPEDCGPDDFPRGEFQCTCSTSTAGYFITERGVERSTVWDMDMVVKAAEKIMGDYGWSMNSGTSQGSVAKIKLNF